MKVRIIPEQKIEVYQYGELDENAKQKAVEWFSNGYPDHEWWDSIHEDAARIGLKITSFDLDRNRQAEGKFDGGYMYAMECAEKILKEHGESCETYKTAQKFIADRAGLIAELQDGEEIEDNEKYEELCEDFLKSLLEDYSIMLQKECDYLQSLEHIEEMIIINEYEFTKEGKRI